MKFVIRGMWGLLVIVTALGQNRNLSEGNVFDGEPFLAINPLNTRHLVVAWMGYVPTGNISIKTRVSFDGGDNWTEVNNIGHINPGYDSADPCLAFDNNNNIFLTYIEFDVDTKSGAVLLRKSVDGGLTWEAPVEVINARSDSGKFPIDRPWMVIDTSGRGTDGNIYVTTMPPRIFGDIDPPYRPYFICSDNGGQSFGQWRYLDTVNWLAGTHIRQPTPFPTIASNGVFYAVYPSWVAGQNPEPQFIFASSRNGGMSFSYSTLVQPLATAFTDTLAKRGYPVLSNPADTAHLVFFNLMNVHGDADVFMWESFDAGNTWSQPARINDDPPGNGRMQELIWADFDYDGDLVVTWRDRRNARGGFYTAASEIWGAVRWKDGGGFSPNFRISDRLVDYNDVLALAGNDFMCVKFRHDTIYAVWGDVRSGKLDIWFQKMLPNGSVLALGVLARETARDVTIYPNPAGEWLIIDAFQLKEVVIIDNSGRIVGRFENPANRSRIKITLPHLSSGLYSVQVITDRNKYVYNILKTR